MPILSFQGEERFDVPAEQLFAALTNLDFMASTIPDLTEHEKLDEQNLRCVVRPGFGFLRGTLHVNLTLSDLLPPEQATMLVAAQGIGTRIKIESQLRIATEQAGSRLTWQADVTELGGLIATVSKSLIQAAAEQTIQKTWQAIRRSLVPPNKSASPGRLAGIDFGTVRIGIAITDPERHFVNPYETYTRRTLELDAAYFQKFASNERIVQFVVGLPVHLHGGESLKSEEARDFGDWLTAVTGLPVVFFDERFTTAEARHLLREMDLPPHRRKNKQKLDKLAAHILLTAYLESTTTAHDSPQGLDDY